MDLVIYHCGEAYHADSANIGRGIKCRNCGKLITIEAPHPGLPVRRRFWGDRLKTVFVLICSLVFLAIVLFSFHLANNAPGTHRQLVSLPQPIETVPIYNRSLPNGTDIIELIDRTGRNKLTVINGTAYNAFVKLSNGGTVLQEKYVTADNSVTLENIPDCVCDVMFGTGVDFDGETFTRHDSYLAYDEPFHFSSIVQVDEDAIRYKNSHVTVTLNAVPYGNAPAHRISKETFRATKRP